MRGRGVGSFVEACAENVDNPVREAGKRCRITIDSKIQHPLNNILHSNPLTPLTNKMLQKALPIKPTPIRLVTRFQTPILIARPVKTAKQQKPDNIQHKHLVPLQQHHEIIRVIHRKIKGYDQVLC